MEPLRRLLEPLAPALDPLTPRRQSRQGVPSVEQGTLRSHHAPATRGGCCASPAPDARRPCPGTAPANVTLSVRCKQHITSQQDVDQVCLAGAPTIDDVWTCVFLDRMHQQAVLPTIFAVHRPYSHWWQTLRHAAHVPAAAHTARTPRNAPDLCVIPEYNQLFGQPSKHRSRGECHAWTACSCSMQCDTDE